jgi:hypothetical protein
MSLTVFLALFGWPLVVVAMFTIMRPSRALLVCYFGAWLFLPMVVLKINGLPNYDKWAAASVGAMAGSLIVGGAKFSSLRPGWYDIPMFAWFISPFLTNALIAFGAYEGFLSLLVRLSEWVIPYVLGRAYFRDRTDVVDLTKAFVIAGLVYVPFCLYEVRMSPQCHTNTYGVFQHEFGQAKRGGGFRPIVYMQHPLAVSGFLSFALATGWWLWRSKLMQRLWGFNTGWFLAGIAATLVLCKTSSGLLLAFFGLLLFGIARVLRWRWVLALSVLLPMIYMGGKLTGVLGDQMLLNLVRQFSEEDRVGSFQTRLNSERVVLDGLTYSPILGFGRWAAVLEFAKNTENRTVIPDAYWVIIVGSTGLLGLASYIGIFMVPVLLLCQKIPSRQLLSETWVPVTALMMVVGLYYLDCLMNSMLSPMFPLVLGALTSVATEDRYQISNDA